MGTKGRSIVGMDIDALLKVLNKAFADEWLAYYQYWLGAKIIKGPMKGEVEAELLEHAGEELGHAEMIAKRIITLGGVPLTNPEYWMKETTCGYEEPTSEFVLDLLHQNIEAEQCAIAVYKKLAEMTQGKDPLTYFMALQIMSDEVDHEEELQALLEDLEFMMMKK